MRAVVLLLAVAASACSIQRVASGTATFTSTPSAPERTGAAGTEAVVCVSASKPRVLVDVGGACVLEGRWDGRREGGSSALHPIGDCTLPSGGEPMHLAISTGVLDVEVAALRRGGTVEVTLGGLDEQRRYVTYRFVGAVIDDGTAEPRCASMSAVVAE